MNIFPLIGIGISTLNSKREKLDVRYHVILTKDHEILNTQKIKLPEFKKLEDIVNETDEDDQLKEELSKLLSLKEAYLFFIK